MSYVLLNGTILGATFASPPNKQLHAKLYRLAFPCLRSSQTKSKPAYVFFDVDKYGNITTMNYHYYYYYCYQFTVIIVIISITESVRP